MVVPIYHYRKGGSMCRRKSNIKSSDAKVVTTVYKVARLKQLV